MEMTQEEAHRMAKARWGRNSFASEIEGVYQIGVYIGPQRAVMGEGDSFSAAVRAADLPRTSAKRKAARERRLAEERDRGR
jgi:hypothetical protein